MTCDLITIKETFEKGDIGLLLGFAKGFGEYTRIPKLFKTPETLDMLIYDEFCNQNLSTYILDAIKSNIYFEKPVGILVKPCDKRAIIELIRENKINKNKIVIFEMPCKGVIDSKKVDRANELCDKCLTCDCNDKKIEAVESEKKTREDWIKEYEKCIRCDACRKVCPMCYCANCIFDKQEPKFLGDEVNAGENGIFLMIRAMHLAGRCTHCGRCNEVCSAKIDHSAFHAPLSKYVEETFDFKTGEDNDKQPVLTEANMEEKKDFEDM